MAAEDGRIRCRWRFEGRVQGVGFRPALARLAGELGLDGWVANDPQGVVLELEGPSLLVEAFLPRFLAHPPPLARIEAQQSCRLAVTQERGFTIRTSQAEGRPDLAITPDSALCADCRRELADPRDRRHQHPFITCTNCGPRYSIILDAPYDRDRTTMAGFALCPRCQVEYHDPLDRRHHAQPIACPDCGPRLAYHDQQGRPVPGQPLALAADLLRAGGILAVKGLGGFHLACRADRQDTVLRLRAGKGREAKPLAVMVADLATARRLADLDPLAEAALTTPAAPIVLVPRRAEAPLAEAVAPGHDRVGLMLPYTPLHLLLLQAGPPVLVMTSGNPSSEPLCHDDHEAHTRLAGLADAFLGHDRPIARPLDDSVVLPDPDGPILLRRARGLVPDPILLPLSVEPPLLALGGDLKSVVGFASGRRATLSEHLGDLEHPAAYRHMTQAIARLGRLLRLEPARLVADLHPGYHSHRLALTSGRPLTLVQHHQAHLAACLAEHGRTSPTIGIVADGTGYGPDGTIWGGEILLLDGPRCRRVGHLSPFPLPGGDRATRETWRPAAGLLAHSGLAWPDLPQFQGLDRSLLHLTATRLAAGRGVLPCTSLGRLCDAVAFLLGLVALNRYEGEAAMHLETVAARAAAEGPELPCPLRTGPDHRTLIDHPVLIGALLAAASHGTPVPQLARSFHRAVAQALATAAVHQARRHSLDTVAVSGGCFVNRLLLDGVRDHCRKAGLRLLSHRLVPPGDGGLALGQLLVAAQTGAGVALCEV